jgi:hypothetical protein
LLACSGAAANGATFVVVDKDTAGFGLNDATAFTPVGGNNATTLGQARLNVITEAARIWGNQISSSQNIVIDAQFADQTCTASSGTLASAGPLTYFTGGPLPLANVLYPAALADALASTNVNSRDDINMTINSKIGSGPSCLNGRSFYLGLDHVNGANIDLLNTLLHEIGHGLGFVSLTDQTGASLDNPANGGSNRLSVFDQFIYYETLGKFWPAMTNAERAAASISNGALVWNGAAVNAQLSRMTAGLSNPGGRLRLYAPATWSDGSSVSHWDTVATPDLLMEPFLRPNPQALTDMTGCVLRDMGWSSTSCPDLAGFNLPLATAQTVLTNEDTAVQLTIRGTDPDTTGPLIYTITAQPTRGVLSTTASPTSANGVLYTYTPFADANGTDSFVFQVSDGTKVSTPATVTINVAAVDDAPVAVPQSLSVSAGTALNVVLSAHDVDGDALSYAVVTGPANGTLSGTAPNLTYSSAAGFTGTDSFTFQASDGVLTSASAMVSISVAGPPGVSASASSSGGGGGGSLDWLGLAALGGMVIRRVRCGFGARRFQTLNS